MSTSDDSNPLRALMRDVLRDEMRELLKSEARAAIKEMMQPTESVQHRAPRTFTMRHGRNALVRVNPTFIGPPAAPGTQRIRVWDAIRQWIGDKAVTRVTLTREMEKLFNVREGGLSTVVTYLLDKKALIVVEQAAPVVGHAVGEAYRE